MASSVVLTFSVIAVGAWVSSRVSDGVLRATSGAAALYVTNFIEPHVQSVNEREILSTEEIARLDGVSELLHTRRHVVSIKIWRPDGVIVYSNRKRLIGKQFETTAIAASLRGQIRAGMAAFDDDDSEFERSLSVPLYEIFLPLYSNQTGEIIAVAEIYEDARALLQEQASAASGAWLVVISAGLATLLVLFTIVYRGSLTIEKQRNAIKQRFREALQLHRRNDVLKSQVEEALRTTAQIDDLIHTRLGIELHDGPAQLISFVLLRLDEVEEALKGGPAHTLTVVRELRSAVDEALKELRAIAAGLVLPNAGDTKNVVSAVQSVICAHERRTNCSVVLDATNVPKYVPPEVIRCVARVVQQALNNAYKHSGGTNQIVTLCSDGVTLRLSIRDDGRGIPQRTSASEPHIAGLGMVGMESRVRSVGGSFSINSEDGCGAEIICAIPVAPGSKAESVPEPDRMLLNIRKS